MGAASMNAWTPLEATAVSVAAASCCTIINMTVRKVQYVSWPLLGDFLIEQWWMLGQFFLSYFNMLHIHSTTTLSTEGFHRNYFSFWPKQNYSDSPNMFSVKLYFCFHYDVFQWMPFPSKIAQWALVLKKRKWCECSEMQLSLFCFFSGMWYCYKQRIGHYQQPQLAWWISQQEGLHLVSFHHPRSSNQTCMSVDFFFSFEHYGVTQIEELQISNFLESFIAF